jgi:hypothetical protein
MRDESPPEFELQDSKSRRQSEPFTSFSTENVDGVKSAMDSTIGGVPRLALGDYPTPVRQPRMNGSMQFWIKDDGACSELYGGNKIRKLEYLLAHAKQTGRSRIVVHGDMDSHTVLACGLIGRRAGFDVDAVVFRMPGQPENCSGIERLAAAGVAIHRRSSMLAAVFQAHWLPTSFTRAVFTEKCNKVFETILNYASLGLKWAA